MKENQKKYIKSQDGNAAPHVGDMVLQTIKKKKVYQAALARNMNRNIKTLGAYFDRHSLQTSILWELSIALKTNFFADIAVQLPDTFASPIQDMMAAKDAEIEQLQQEIAQLKTDKELLISLIRK